MEIGFFVAAGKGSHTPPLDCNSLTMRPPREATREGLARASGDAAFAADCHARFVSMYRETVGVEVVPDDPWAQLRGAVEAVFRSWNSDRARTYRSREGIPDDLGTAGTIQAMVFGNRGPDSGTGVLFTRDPATGEAVLYGDVMFGAQGEDVVAGTHHTEQISVLDERMPAVGAELRRYAETLERHYTDLCDIEFTIEQGRLWMLQVRVGKRSPQAALRMAIDMAEDPDFPLTRADAVRRVAALLVDPPRVATERDDVGPALTAGLPASSFTLRLLRWARAPARAPGRRADRVQQSRRSAEPCAQ